MQWVSPRVTDEVPTECPQEALNKAVLTEQYDINRWFRNFGARPKHLFRNPLNDLLFSHAGLEYRQTYHNGAGITFQSMLLSSPLLVSAFTPLVCIR